MRMQKLALASSLVAIPVLVLGGRTVAQEGLAASLTIGERLRVVNETGPDRDGDDGTSAVTTLDFNLTSQTNTQTLGLSLNTALPLYLDGGPDDDNFEFEDPDARLNYSIESKNALLGVNAIYRRTDVGDGIFFDEDLNQDVVTGGGTRTLFSFAPSLIVGRDGPVTSEFGYRYVSDTFSETADSSDSNTNAANARISFRISPVLDTFVFARYSEEEREGTTQTDRITSAYGVGASYALNPVTNIRASFSFDDDETVDQAGNVVSSNDGLGFEFDLQRARPNGTYRLSLSREETINGTRYNTSLGRNIELPRGILDASLGLSKNDGESVEPLFNISLSRAVSETSQLNFRFSQSASINDADNNVIRTRASVDYTYQINTLSNLSAGLQFADDNETGAGAIDERTLSVNLNYNYALGQEWDMVSGVSFRNEKSTGSLDSRTSTVFVGLQKRFDW